MSHALTPAKAPCILADIKPEWIATRNEIIKRDGYQVRRGFGASVEIHSAELGWMPLRLPGEVTQFCNEADRDAVLIALTQP